MSSLKQDQFSKAFLNYNHLSSKCISMSIKKKKTQHNKIYAKKNGFAVQTL